MCVCTAAVMAAPAGYLRTLGPVPLRFQSIAVPVASLPPLEMKEKPAENPLPAAAPPASAPTNSVPGTVPPAEPNTNPASANPPPIVIVPPPAQPPQDSAFGSDLPKVMEMLLSVPGSTNAAGNRILVMPAVPFTPPLAAPASSSATYQSAPDQLIKTP
jgi:hypothetical protein